jgi:tetratricopeptide (TPR) repeat protein
LPEIVLVALPAVVVVEEGIHVFEFFGNLGRPIGCPVVLKPLVGLVLVRACFYHLAEDAPYSPVKVFCHCLLLIHRISYIGTATDTTEDATCGNGGQRLRYLGKPRTREHYRRDPERATDLYEESMDLFSEQGDKQSLAYCLNNLGMVVYSQGDLGRAAQLTEEGVALVSELGARVDVALGLGNLGWIALLQDDLGRAADLYRESLSLSWDIGLTPLVQSALEGCACLAGAKGEAQRAVRLWGAAQSLHETKGIPRDDDFLAEADARISAVRLGMGEETWKEAWRKGRVMTLDEAVSYALEQEAGG